MATIPTSAVTFVETEHGRLRRKQRGIDKKDLQAAKKKGVRQGSFTRQNGDKTAKYTYKDIVYIVNETTQEEITSYALPLELDEVSISSQVLHSDQLTRRVIMGDPDIWTSHFVLVVDTSGSMRASDIWGARDRLSAVWLSLALDFLAHRLETGAAGPTDVISVVTLSNPPTTLLQNEPSTWVLYNRLRDIYRYKKVQPCGHGPFLPALKVAESILMGCVQLPCAAGLLFLSDGRPSDKGMSKEDCADAICSSVGSLAKRFGRRLTFQAVGIGDMGEFAMLRSMVAAAKDFGAQAQLQIPSLTSSDLGCVFTTVATSITSTQAEMTEVGGTKQLRVRQVIQESRRKANEVLKQVTKDEFHLYPANKVKRTVYREWIENGTRRTAFEEAPLQHPNALFVAMAKSTFGEGAERFAYRFFEVAADGKTIVGKPLVAKESRLVLDSGLGDESSRRKFVRTFCSTQQLAGRLAKEFNKKLLGTRRADPLTPTVRFLDCSVYQLDDINLGGLSVLVEQKLDHEKWQKWNANNGYVEGMKSVPEISQERIREAVLQLASVGMDAIAEGSEDDDSSESDADDAARAQTFKTVVFSPHEVAQAFSHFTYRASGKKRLVCDLQGVFDEQENALRFSDPVIHYYNQNRRDRRQVHGRTDRGGKGVAMFFETHREGHCGHLCRLMLRGFHNMGPGPRRAQDRVAGGER